MNLLESGKLWCVDAPHFCASFVEAQDGDIVKAAPIIAWAMRQGWNGCAFRQYCKRKGWKVYPCNGN